MLKKHLLVKTSPKSEKENVVIFKGQLYPPHCLFFEAQNSNSQTLEKTFNVSSPSDMCLRDNYVGGQGGLLRGDSLRLK